MNIRRAGREIVRSTGGVKTSYRIGFVNERGEEDETELDTASINDLDALWHSLCSEFQCKPNAVTYVERVSSV